jgi:hypothetical protein
MGRFPTEKAYGVTTMGTIKSLVRQGHEVTIFALRSQSAQLQPLDDLFHLISYEENILISKLKNIAFKSSSIIKLTFFGYGIHELSFWLRKIRNSFSKFTRLLKKGGFED